MAKANDFECFFFVFVFAFILIHFFFLFLSFSIHVSYSFFHIMYDVIANLFNLFLFLYIFFISFQYFDFDANVYTLEAKSCKIICEQRIATNLQFVLKETNNTQQNKQISNKKKKFICKWQSILNNTRPTRWMSEKKKKIPWSLLLKIAFYVIEFY